VRPKPSIGPVPISCLNRSIGPVPISCLSRRRAGTRILARATGSVPLFLAPSTSNIARPAAWRPKTPNRTCPRFEGVCPRLKGQETSAFRNGSAGAVRVGFWAWGRAGTGGMFRCQREAEFLVRCPGSGSGGFWVEKELGNIQVAPSYVGDAS
jgi:hypothetical protein